MGFFYDLFMNIIDDLYKSYLKHPKITTDSRQDVNGSIFFGIKGERFDGNKFAGDAISNGAVMAVVDDPEMRGEKIMTVKNSLLTLQELASFHRSQLDIPILGLTGSNGKTTTKELIASVLAKKYRVAYTKGNLNNHIGVPLTLLDIDHSHEIAVVEMGANHVGEIAQLCNIARPAYGLITNIGKAHLEGFGGFEGVVKAKTELYKYILANGGTVFVNTDHLLLDELSKKIPRITYGSMPQADCHAKIAESFSCVKIKWENVKGEQLIRSNLFGAFNFENIVAAICVGNFFRIEEKHIKEVIESYHPSNNRSQIIRAKNNTIIMDAYNANPTSMESGLRQFAASGYQRKAVVLGDMLELGQYCDAEHQAILQLLDELKFERTILVGDSFCRNNNKFICFEKSEDAAKHLADNPIKDATIYIKGSRGIGLEKVLPALKI